MKRDLTKSHPRMKAKALNLSKEINMSQCSPFEGKEAFGSRSKIRYEPYTDEELASDEFFWNQLNTIVYLRNKEYFYHFINARSAYIDKMSGM